MKKSDLFDIAIKLFGFSLLVDTIVGIKDSVLVLSAQSEMYTSVGKHDNYSIFYGYGVSLGIQLLFALLLIFQSRFVTRKMIKSTEDPSADFTIDKRLGIEIAAMIVGGLMIVKSVNTLGYQIIRFVETLQADYSPESKGFAQMIWQVILITAGFFLVASHKSIAGYFVRRDERQKQ